MSKVKADRVKLNKGWWYCGPYDEHEYVVYECGCNFHKVIELKKHEGRKKWSFCKQHLKKLDNAKEIYNFVWNNIMEGKVVKSSTSTKNRRSLPNIEESDEKKA